MEEFDNFLVLLNSPGKKDYKKSFSLGVERLDKIDKIKYDPYDLFKKRLFFGGRNLKEIKSNPFSIICGFKPLARFHLGHLFFSRQIDTFQNKKNKVYLFLAFMESKLRKKANIKSCKRLSNEFLKYLFASSKINMRNVKIIRDDSENRLIKLALSLSTKTNLNKVKKTFGFDDGDSFSKIIFPFFISADYLYPQIKFNESKTLILGSLCHDSLIRFTNDLAKDLKLEKVSSVYSMAVPDIKSLGLMTNKNSNRTIYLDENIKEIEKKLLESETGGRKTLKEQKTRGGMTKSCNYFKIISFLLSYNQIKDTYLKCLNGISCKECKIKNNKEIIKIILKIKKRKNNLKNYLK